MLQFVEQQRRWNNRQRSVRKLNPGCRMAQNGLKAVIVLLRKGRFQCRSSVEFVPWIYFHFHLHHFQGGSLWQDHRLLHYWKHIHLSCDEKRQTESIRLVVLRKLTNQSWIPKPHFIHLSHPTMFSIIEKLFAHLATKKGKQTKSIRLVVLEILRHLWMKSHTIPLMICNTDIWKKKELKKNQHRSLKR